MRGEIERGLVCFQQLLIKERFLLNWRVYLLMSYTKNSFIAILILLIVVSCGDDKSSYNANNYNNVENTITYNDTNQTMSDRETKENIGSKIPLPQPIVGTKHNERPIIYDRGKSGGTLILGEYSGDPKTFNVILATENTSTNVIRRFQISLMEYDEDRGEWFVYPGDRKKGMDNKGYDVNITDDGRQILTIFLRKDVYWTDGERMTAEDWVWFWNNIYTDRYISPAGYNKASVKMEDGSIETIKAIFVDDFTFKLVFPRVVAEPELSINFSPMPQHILKPIVESEGIEKTTQLWDIDTPVSDLVGNGPWILTKYNHNMSLVFQSNPDFFLKDEWEENLPYLEKLIINIVPDATTLYLNFMGRDIDAYYVNNADFKRIVEKADGQDYTVWNGGLAPDMEFITFNQNIESDYLKDNPKRNWFTHKEFRQALSYIIDRDAIETQIFNSLAEPSDTYLSRASPYYDPDITCDITYDSDKAMKLLQKIGIRDRNGDGKLEDDEENIIKFEILTNYGNTQREKMIGILANEWRTYGITVNPLPIEFNVLVTKLTQTFDWDCVLISLEGGLFPFDDNLYLSNGSMHLWYPMQSEPATEWEANINDLYRKAKYEPDFELRKDLFDDMYDILYEELPLIPILRKYTFSAVYNKWGNVFWDVWTEIGGRNNIRVFKK